MAAEDLDQRCDGYGWDVGLQASSKHWAMVNSWSPSSAHLLQRRRWRLWWSFSSDNDIQASTVSATATSELLRWTARVVRRCLGKVLGFVGSFDVGVDSVIAWVFGYWDCLGALGVRLEYKLFVWSCVNLKEVLVKRKLKIN